MLESLSLPLDARTAKDYGGWTALRRQLATLGLDGLEGIWSGEDIPADFPREMLIGYHLTFHPDWLDFYLEHRCAMQRKFGSLDKAYAFYGGQTPDTLLRLYIDDYRRAAEVGAQYAVFHISDISIEEGYTYRWLHTNKQVICTAAEIVRKMLRAVPNGPLLLLENQWWPGLTMTEPKETALLLDRVGSAHVGLLLDTGHLMNCNTAITNEQDGIDYILQMLWRHGSLCEQIYGIHLHQSCSGAYVRRHTGAMPADMPQDYAERFGVSYAHILQIDQHRPWTNPAVNEIIHYIAPKFLTHELSGSSPAQRLAAVRRQKNTLRRMR